MVANQQSERYTADQALRHPWITRNEYDDIPFSFAEEQAAFNKAQSLIFVLKIYLILFYLKKLSKKIIKSMIFCKYLQINKRNHDAQKIDKSFYEIKVINQNKKG